MDQMCLGGVPNSNWERGVREGLFQEVTLMQLLKTKKELKWKGGGGGGGQWS